MATPFMLSKDKIEMQFATNFLGMQHMLQIILWVSILKFMLPKAAIVVAGINECSPFCRY